MSQANRLVCYAKSRYFKEYIGTLVFIYMEQVGWISDLSCVFIWINTQDKSAHLPSQSIHRVHINGPKMQPVNDMLSGVI